MRGLPSYLPKIDSFPLAGGVDQMIQPIAAKPGTLISSINYEPAIPYGYSRVKGYERFDGQTRPSDSDPLAVDCDLSVDPVLGDELTIGAVTCLFVKRIAGGMIVTQNSGTIPDVTDIVLSSSVIGMTDAPAQMSYGPSASEDAQNRHDAACAARLAIGKPPGSGAVRGVCFYNGVLYAFRDNAGGDACVMHKATAAGWVAVDVGEELSFTNADAEISDGDTVTKGAVSATISRVVLETGDWGGTNSGRLIIAGRTGGSFSSGAGTFTGGGNLTIGGASADIVFDDGGKFEFVIHNFYGGTLTRRMYGCDGKNRAFEFDGTVIVPIDTKTPTDKPSHITVHRNYLFLSFGSSSINSSAGNPYRYVADEGAAEIPVGDDIVGYAPLPGEALCIASRSQQKALIGADSDTWSLTDIAPENGGLPWSIQTMGSQTYLIDDRGITSISQSQAYGNFDIGTMSQHIQKFINAHSTKVNCSMVVRASNQYRLFFDDGTVLIMRPPIGKNRAEFLPLSLPVVANVCHSEEDLSGNERLFVGGTDGYVYELNRGSSADGDEISSYLRLWPITSGAPMLRKTFGNAWLGVTTELYSSVKVIPELSYNDPDAPELPHISSGDIAGAGALWGTADWSEFFWSAQDAVKPKIDIKATGDAVGFVIYSDTAIDFGHTIQSVTLDYFPRRMSR